MPTKFGNIVAARACVRTGGILEAADPVAPVFGALFDAPPAPPDLVAVVEGAAVVGAGRAMFIL